MRPDIEVRDLRGNVNTRVRKLQEGEYDAIILACAGLERLQMDELITEALAPPRWLPAGTQGTIGIQNRSGDEEVKALISPLMNPEAVTRTRAERGVATLLHGSCQVPLAVFAELESGQVRIRSMVGTPDGSRILQAAAEGPEAETDNLASAVANDLLEQGAGKIIAALS